MAIDISQIVIYLSISSKHGKNCLPVKGLIGFFFLSPIKLSCFEIPQIAINFYHYKPGENVFKSDRLMATELFISDKPLHTLKIVGMTSH